MHTHFYTNHLLLLLCSLFYSYYYLSWCLVTLPCPVHIYLKYLCTLIWYWYSLYIAPFLRNIYSSSYYFIYIYFFFNSTSLGRARKHRWEGLVRKHFMVKSRPVVFGACDKYNLILMSSVWRAAWWTHLDFDASNSASVVSIKSFMTPMDLLILSAAFSIMFGPRPFKN